MASKRKFVDGWLSDLSYKKWLKKVDGRPYCTNCKSSLRCHKAALDEHLRSAKHVKNCDSESIVKNTRSLDALGFITPEVASRKKTELRIVGFIAEHCSINSVDHLSELLKCVFPDNPICQQIHLHRTKCTRLIKKVLAPCLREEILDDVRSSYYSLLIDESTDIGTCKMLALVLRYFSRKQRKIVTTFYRLVCIDGGDAESISEVILDCLKNDGLELFRLIGIGTDNASVMVGQHHSVYKILKGYQENLILVKCICHSLALAASYASQKLPSHLDYLIEQTHSWFSRSSLRQGKYAEIYKTMNSSTPPHKLLKYVKTRWLSRYECVCRILENWETLQLYFKEVSSTERSYLSSELSNMYEDNINYAYFTFLRSILKMVCQVSYY